ncbi:hypothetical protein ATANTOWER_022595 [Ataeniobius toweri]|uniref:Uncharacterized protein n=1 Tax=Ataeniobius toweri TaxID=208326 RepID=A0ABU7CA14_9TELE|nr:hypothetical protein [Ataeniobius toweri]
MEATDRAKRVCSSTLPAADLLPPLRWRRSWVPRDRQLYIVASSAGGLYESGSPALLRLSVFALCGL